MKRFLTVLAVVGVIAALSAVPVLAKGPTGPAGKSNMGHLYLVEKDPVTWEVIEDGAWGKMTYRCNDDAFWFVFNGHGLEPGAAYALINYLDPWPGTGSLSLASGTVNEEGDIHLAGSVPCLQQYDYGDGVVGAKIWLVRAGDFDEAAHNMVGWNPTEYLFEYDLLTCCGCPAVE